MSTLDSNDSMMFTGLESHELFFWYFGPNFRFEDKNDSVFILMMFGPYYIAIYYFSH